LSIVDPTYTVLGKKNSEVIGAGKDREWVRAGEARSDMLRLANCTELSVTALAMSFGVDATCISRSIARMDMLEVVSGSGSFNRIVATVAK
jgi:hypothetical protein